MDDSTWLTAFRNWLGATQSSAVAVCFPSYRPELVMSLATELGYSHFDFRRACMAPLGWNAGTLPLASIAEAITGEMASGQPIVVQNVEALLAVHPPQARKECLADLLNRSWPQRLVIVLALYAADVPPGAPNAFAFHPSQMPEETLLVRLAGMR